ncbi:protein of unknown function [Paraburkholderia dioscoreae]|uniref:Uncharacterized protein n=1 Tax=Paraburkholderia dioscoreae TaxID=2604047 RepID=A0A5Q4ZCV2_9BURK|nr:protein of unknown function [Paraburkholderia dioscoreae]
MHTENPQEKVRRNEIWEESERNRSRTYTSFRRFADSSIAHANFRQCDGMASFLLSVLPADNTLNTTHPQAPADPERADAAAFTGCRRGTR